MASQGFITVFRCDGLGGRASVVRKGDDVYLCAPRVDGGWINAVVAGQLLREANVRARIVDPERAERGDDVLHESDGVTISRRRDRIYASFHVQGGMMNAVVSGRLVELAQVRVGTGDTIAEAKAESDSA
jgi:hypothetical protein